MEWPSAALLPMPADPVDYRLEPRSARLLRPRHRVWLRLNPEALQSAAFPDFRGAGLPGKAASGHREAARFHRDFTADEKGETHRLVSGGAASLFRGKTGAG